MRLSVPPVTSTTTMANMQDLPDSFSALRRLRVERGLTQVDLAVLSGRGINTIAVAEKYPQRMTKASAAAIAKALGVSVEEIIEQPAAPEEEP